MAIWESHTPGKPRYCLTPGTLQKPLLVLTRPRFFFSGTSMKLLNEFCFEIGSDFGLRIGFSLIQEVNEGDKAQFHK